MQEQYSEVFKIILVGDSTVGKSNLIHTYVTQKPLPRTMPTIGIQFTTKIIQAGSTKVKAQIWDTAGQERYKSISMNNFRNAVGALVVFDVTNKSSFKSVTEWVQVVRERAKDNCQIGILANKIDENRRAVTQQQAKKLASHLNCFYLETTIHQYHLVKEAFQRLILEVDKVHGHKTGREDGVHLRDNDKSNQGGCKC